MVLAAARSAWRLVLVGHVRIEIWTQAQLDAALDRTYGPHAHLMREVINMMKDGRAAHPDDIQTTIMTSEAGIARFCPGCNSRQFIFVGETKGGDTIVVCSTCHSVISRRRTETIPKLQVN